MAEFARIVVFEFHCHGQIHIDVLDWWTAWAADCEYCYLTSLEGDLESFAMNLKWYWQDLIVLPKSRSSCHLECLLNLQMLHIDSAILHFFIVHFGQDTTFTQYQCVSVCRDEQGRRTQSTADPSLLKHIGKLRWPHVSKRLRPRRALFCDDDDDDDVSLIDTFRLPADWS